jgi:hypothetical protein
MSMVTESAADGGAGSSPTTSVPNEVQPAAPAPVSRRLYRWLYVIPLLILLFWISLPLVRGTETLVMRDVLNAHLEMKWAQAIAMRHGTFPLIDPWRAGGQPLAGNPNAVPFYPTNLLFLAGTSIFWAFNAHFWIHLLLAPFAFAWLGRRCGLGREAAWAAAACYTLSGFYLSHLSFYNLIAGATVAPAFAAACIALGDANARRRWLIPPAVALLWALLLLGGDPLLAVLALVLALATAWVFWPRQGRGGHLLLLLVCGIVGTGLASPQIVEFWRILPLSFRGYWGYTSLLASVASWDPRQIAEWFLPTLFGRLDVIGPGSFWGKPYFTDTPPYYVSLYPGLLTLALVAVSGVRREAAAPRLRRYAWCAIGCGLFLALGRFNPLLTWAGRAIEAIAGLHPSLSALRRLSGGSLVRYPVKFWLPVAVGAALLCGLGFERLLRDDESTASPRAWAGLRLGFTALGGLLLAMWAFLTFRVPQATSFLHAIIPDHYTLLFVNNERLRWAGLCIFSLIAVAALWLCTSQSLRQHGHQPTAAGLLLVVHAVAQLLLLRSVYPMDSVVPYRVPPPVLAALPEEEHVINPDLRSLFGESRLASGRFPDRRSIWLERRAFYELYPPSAPLWRRHFELTESPEGLDSFLTRVAEEKIKRATNEDRVRLLAAWGVGRLILDRPLNPPASGAQLIARFPDFGQALYVYSIPRRAPEIALARRVFYAPSVNDSTPFLTRPDFVPGNDVVIPGSGAPRPLGGGTVRVLQRGPERIDLDTVVGDGGSILVLQRALLLFQATIDGAPAPLVAANLQHMGLVLPAGHHRVRLFIDRRDLHAAAWVALAAFLLLPLLALLARRPAGKLRSHS